MANLFDDFLDLVPKDLYGERGAVFYSGRSAFSVPRHLYLLGLNPGGDEKTHAQFTIGKDIAIARERVDDYSAYEALDWVKDNNSYTPMQCRIQHMFTRLKLRWSINGRLSDIPSSNVTFLGTQSEKLLKQKDASRSSFFRCWPVHQAVIDRLGIGTVLCLGQTAGDWVCEQLGARTEIGPGWQETYKDRHWRSRAHRNEAGQRVLTLTHPSRANWRNSEADPTPWVAEMMTH